MLNFKVIYDKNNIKCLETTVDGKHLLTTPQLNKGTAFTTEERLNFNLMGKLPPRIETLEEQLERAFQQYSSYENDLQRNIYLNSLHDKNQVLFYKLVSTHIKEMMPLIYTPIVGKAVKKFSKEFRQPRGLYIAKTDEDYIDNILENRSNPDIDLIVVTDGEGVLGIGDQGVGGMDIPVAKLMVYSLCGGIDPCRTLPVCLDVGTNNQELLADPLYLGLKQKRLVNASYDDFIEKFIQSIQKKFPNVFLHWEDFGRANARKILDKYKDKICTFNDDIQGTGAVALASILAAVQSKEESMQDQRFMIYGAGTAGMGITDQIFTALVRHFNMTEEEAKKRFWLLDRQGLIIQGQDDLTPRQTFYARDPADIETQCDQGIYLHDAIELVKPTVLIGCSARGGAFDKKAIQAMSQHVQTPIILPLSNPTECAEAQPEDIIEWTDGNVLLASGSPFDPVHYSNRSIHIAQCNNALAFPGIGLGIIAVKAKRLTESMIWAATKTLSEMAPVLDKALEKPAPLLPSIEKAQEVARKIAIEVAKQAYTEGLTPHESEPNYDKLVDSTFWQPNYLPFRKAMKNSEK